MPGLPPRKSSDIFGSLMKQIFPIREPDATIGIQEDSLTAWVAKRPAALPGLFYVSLVKGQSD